MGSWFQEIVDPEASLSEAEQLAPQILRLLIDQSIVQPELKNCGLRKNGLGYAPGDNYKSVVNDVIGRDIRVDLLINGFQITIGRTVFDCGQGEFDLICPACKTGNEVIDQWGDAVSEWYDDTGSGLLQCSHCGQNAPVIEWNYEPTMAFGNLGFTFWNWPPLKDSFIADISQQLGHSIRFVSGKV